MYLRNVHILVCYTYIVYPNYETETDLEKERRERKIRRETGRKNSQLLDSVEESMTHCLKGEGTEITHSDIIA